MIRFGLIGVGRWGTNILNTLKEIKGVEVVVDSGDGVDGVIVATPGSTHAEVAMPYVEAGVPTFIEKPMTTSLKDAKRIKRAAKSIVMVGHLHLYNPSFLKVKELAGKIGKICMISFEGMNDGPVRNDMSALWDWGPHGVSMMVDLLGKAPREAQAWGHTWLKPGTKVYDAAEVKLIFPGNVEGMLSVNWLAPEKRVKLTMIGSKGSVIWDDASNKKVALHRGDKLTHPRYGKQRPLKLELEAFIEAIKMKKQPLADVNNGLAVVKILSAAEKSITLDGKRVTMDKSGGGE
ncbi:MAG: Gfo/Idh/MocA family oxidoreductase [bacterium]